MRAQVSLVFTDQEVYDYLIKPLKESRELNSLIVKLLQCYYYNESIQVAVDSEGMQTEHEFRKSMEHYQNAMEIVGTMDIILEDGKNSIQEGFDNYQDLARAAQRATSRPSNTSETEDIKYLTSVVESMSDKVDKLMEKGVSMYALPDSSPDSVFERSEHSVNVIDDNDSDTGVETSGILEVVEDTDIKDVELEVDNSRIGEAKNSLADLIASSMS